MREGVDLMKIKKNLSSCDDQIQDFEEYEKDLLTQQKEDKRTNGASKGHSDDSGEVPSAAAVESATQR